MVKPSSSASLPFTHVQLSLEGSQDIHYPWPIQTRWSLVSCLASYPWLEGSWLDGWLWHAWFLLHQRVCGKWLFQNQEKNCSLSVSQSGQNMSSRAQSPTVSEIAGELAGLDLDNSKSENTSAAVRPTLVYLKYYSPHHWIEPSGNSWDAYHCCHSDQYAHRYLRP